MKANITIEFKNGIGHLEATQYRNSAVVSGVKIRRSGTVTFNDAMPGDSISIDGACAGTTDLAIDVNISPLPQTRSYGSGDFFDEFDIA